MCNLLRSTDNTCMLWRSSVTVASLLKNLCGHPQNPDLGMTAGGVGWLDVGTVRWALAPISWYLSLKFWLPWFVWKRRTSLRLEGVILILIPRRWSNCFESSKATTWGTASVILLAFHEAMASCSTQLFHLRAERGKPWVVATEDGAFIFYAPSELTSKPRWSAQSVLNLPETYWSPVIARKWEHTTFSRK